MPNRSSDSQGKDLTIQAQNANGNDGTNNGYDGGNLILQSGTGSVVPGGTDGKNGNIYIKNNPIIQDLIYSIISYDNLDGNANGTTGAGSARQLPVSSLLGGGFIRISSIPNATNTEIYFPTAAQINNYLSITGTVSTLPSSHARATGFKCTICIVGKRTGTIPSVKFKQQHNVADFRTALYDNTQSNKLSDSGNFAALEEGNSMDVFITCGGQTGPEWNILRVR